MKVVVRIYVILIIPPILWKWWLESWQSQRVGTVSRCIHTVGRPSHLRAWAWLVIAFTGPPYLTPELHTCVCTMPHLEQTTWGASRSVQLYRQHVIQISPDTPTPPHPTPAHPTHHTRPISYSERLCTLEPAQTIKPNRYTVSFR